MADSVNSLIHADQRRLAQKSAAALTLEAAAACSYGIAHLAGALPEIVRARSVMLYLSLPGEVNTTPLIAELRKSGKRLTVPLVAPEHRLLPVELPVNPAALASGTFGVPEPLPEFRRLVDPTELDVIFVPGVAFDPQGHRLGHGAGYYDRFLASLGLEPERGEEAEKGAATAGVAARADSSSPGPRHRPLAIGLAFEAQVLPNISPAPHDIAMDILVTEARVIRLKA